jgi:hypothetical protein
LLSTARTVLDSRNARYKRRCAGARGIQTTKSFFVPSCDGACFTPAHPVVEASMEVAGPEEGEGGNF